MHRKRRKLHRAKTPEEFNGAVSWSFSKDSRFKAAFKPVKTEYTTTLKPSHSRRAASFGYGKRWVPSNFTGKDSPPPGTYQWSSAFNEPKVSGKISPPHNRFKEPRRESMPGPGTYNVSKPIGLGAPMVTLKSRITTRKQFDYPSPGDYRPHSVLAERRRFHDISFGFGERRVFSNMDKDSPGPGSYEQPSSFVKVASRRSYATTPSRPVSALDVS
jgi:hypothetical protein